MADPTPLPAAKPAPSLTLEALKAALEWRKKKQEQPAGPPGQETSLADVIAELKTLNATVNDRLRVYPRQVPS